MSLFGLELFGNALFRDGEARPFCCGNSSAPNTMKYEPLLIKHEQFIRLRKNIITILLITFLKLIFF
jgi:hypothetical protein